MSNAGSKTELLAHSRADLADVIIHEIWGWTLACGTAELWSYHTNPADFARVMPLVMKQVKGKADGKVVQELVKKALGAS